MDRFTVDSLSVVRQALCLVTDQMKPKKKGHPLELFSGMLLKAGLHQACPEEIGEEPAFPSPYWFMRVAKRMLPQDIATRISDELQNLTLKFLPSSLRSNAQIALDIVKIPYYGELNSEYVTGGRAERGTCWFYQFLTASILIEGYRFPLRLQPLKTGFRKKLAGLVREMLTELQTNFTLSLVLLDKGFGGSAPVQVLEILQIPYVVALATNKRLKRISTHLGLLPDPSLPKSLLKPEDGKLRLLTPTGALLDEYTYGKKEVKTRLVLCKFRVKRRRGKRRPNHRWRMAAFATSLNLSPEAFLDLYRKRWGIETGYRIINKFRGWTRSRYVAPRIWFYGTAMLLQAAWIITNILRREEKSSEAFCPDFEYQRWKKRPKSRYLKQRQFIRLALEVLR